MRYFLTIAYDGSAYHGFQKQKNARGIQDVLEERLQTYLQDEVQVVCSGRTDKGVHAREQVIHMDVQKPLTPDFVFRFNRLLPSDIVALRLRRVDDQAHARFDAVRRSYAYLISRQPDPFRRSFSYLYQRSVSISAMREACAFMLEQTDFESFSRVRTDVNHFECSIEKMVWKQHNELLVFYVTANRFLRGMVRALVGTLLDVGEQKKSMLDIKNIFEARDRRKAGRSVPAQGLFLTHIQYPDSIFIED